MPDSKISNLPLYSSPQPNDLIPIVAVLPGGTRRVTVNNLLASSPSAIQPFCRMSLTQDITRNGFYSLTSGGCSNNVNYVIPYDTKIETNSTEIEGNTTNMNIIIKSTGKYLVTGRVGFFDMERNTSNNVYQTARLRLHSSSSPITPSGGGQFNFTGTTLESVLSLNYAAGAGTSGFPYLNGESTWSGTHILYVTSVPLYLQLSIFVFGGAANANTAAYMIASATTYGNQPQFSVQKISN